MSAKVNCIFLPLSGCHYCFYQCVVFCFLTVSPRFGIGCFTFSAASFKEPLADFKGQFDWENTKPVIDKCAELAFSKGYSHFLLGNSGRCYSEKEVKNKYFEKGVLSRSFKCPNEIGKSGAAYVFTFGTYLTESFHQLMDKMRVYIT